MFEENQVSCFRCLAKETSISYFLELKTLGKELLNIEVFSVQKVSTVNAVKFNEKIGASQ